MFDEQTLTSCMDEISGKENFFGLHSPGLSLNGFTTHHKLLEGYIKLHIAKQEYRQK
jgi:ribosomal protein S12 methylthiotransferase accessory factor